MKIIIFCVWLVLCLADPVKETPAKKQKEVFTKPLQLAVLTEVLTPTFGMTAETISIRTRVEPETGKPNDKFLRVGQYVPP